MLTELSLTTGGISVTVFFNKKFQNLPFLTAGVIVYYYMTISLINFITLITGLFLLGITGIVLNRKNILIILMSVELMLLAVNMNLVVFSVYLDDLIGQMFALFVLTVAAAESAIGLAILVVYYRVRGTISVERIHTMRG